MTQRIIARTRPSAAEERRRKSVSEEERLLSKSSLCVNEVKLYYGAWGQWTKKNRIHMTIRQCVVDHLAASGWALVLFIFFWFNVIPVPAVDSPSHKCFNDQCFLKSNTSRLVNPSPLTSPHKISFKTVVITHEASKDS